MNNWNNTTIGDLTIEILGGGTPSTKNSGYWQGDIPWITSKWLNSELYLNTGEKYISDNALKVSATHLIPKDNIIFATRVGVGKAAINKIDLAINQDLAGIIIDKNKVIPEFLVYQVKTSLIQNEIESYKRGATIKGITRDNLKSLKIILPVIDTQKKIVSILFLIQNAIQKQDKIIETITNLKKSLMQKLFTEGLNGEPQKESDIGLIPESWKICKFEELATLQRGKDLTKKEFQVGDFPVAGSSGVIGFHNTSFVKAPGVTVGRSGSCGNVEYYIDDFWAHNTALYVKDFHQNHPKFVYYYLIYLDLSKYKTGASVPTLDRNSFKHIPVAVPPLEQQEEIAAIIESIENKVVVANKVKSNKQLLFNSVLNQLMSGELNVEEIDFN